MAGRDLGRNVGLGRGGDCGDIYGCRDELPGGQLDERIQRRRRIRTLDHRGRQRRHRLGGLRHLGQRRRRVEHGRGLRLRRQGRLRQHRPGFCPSPQRGRFLRAGFRRELGLRHRQQRVQPVRQRGGSRQREPRRISRRDQAERHKRPRRIRHPDDALDFHAGGGRPDFGLRHRSRRHGDLRDDGHDGQRLRLCGPCPLLFLRFGGGCPRPAPELFRQSDP